VHSLLFVSACEHTPSKTRLNAFKMTTQNDQCFKSLRDMVDLAECSWIGFHRRKIAPNLNIVSCVYLAILLFGFCIRHLNP
jgi:hypothetical protein